MDPWESCEVQQREWPSPTPGDDFSSAEKDLRVLVGSKFNKSHQCALVANNLQQPPGQH